MGIIRLPSMIQNAKQTLKRQLHSRNQPAANQDVVPKGHLQSMLEISKGRDSWFRYHS
ncbi:hypothetical protein Ddye_004060 [Dipteronia dyeriana]|uniref:Uncharacterized protein n=1 Tax=Dipteronia dyeriana TaxID=168575 RepID=A0AAE0CVY6_9ROSI|nr:hypothetical protein Ddye_004060 [Dipteronia dyeriana]